MNLTFANPPEQHDPHQPSKSEIAEALMRRPGKWAIVAYCDRVTRAEQIVERIEAGTEYGPDFEAVRRRVGNQHRVYARWNAWNGEIDDSADTGA